MEEEEETEMNGEKMEGEWGWEAESGGKRSVCHVGGKLGSVDGSGGEGKLFTLSLSYILIFSLIFPDYLPLFHFLLPFHSTSILHFLSFLSISFYLFSLSFPPFLSPLFPLSFPPLYFLSLSLPSASLLFPSSLFLPSAFPLPSPLSCLSSPPLCLPFSSALVMPLDRWTRWQVITVDRGWDECGHREHIGGGSTQVYHGRWSDVACVVLISSSSSSSSFFFLFLVLFFLLYWLIFLMVLLFLLVVCLWACFPVVNILFCLMFFWGYSPISFPFLPSFLTPSWFCSGGCRRVETAAGSVSSCLVSSVWFFFYYFLDGYVGGNVASPTSANGESNGNNFIQSAASLSLLIIISYLSFPFDALYHHYHHHYHLC